MSDETSTAQAESARPAVPQPPDDDDRPRATGLRRGLRRLGLGLIVYGVIGIAIAILGGVAMFAVSDRIDAMAARATSQVELAASVLDQTATVLEDASATSASFALTLERTPPTVRQAAQTVGNLQASLLALQAQLDALTILGTRPLSTTADRFGQMATELDGLDARLGLIAGDLEGNRDALLANSRSLAALADRISDVADELRGGAFIDAIADVGAVLRVMILVLAAWTAVPAIGALGLGLWIRAEVNPDDD